MTGRVKTCPAAFVLEGKEGRRRAVSWFELAAAKVGKIWSVPGVSAVVVYVSIRGVAVLERTNGQTDKLIWYKWGEWLGN